MDSTYISYLPPENYSSSDEKNYTIASTFEKVKSLKFELLFGEWEKKVCKDDSDDVINAVDYYFAPGQIFGFVCTSYGDAYQRFHHALVLRACSPCETGNIINGVVPGAEVLLATSTSVAGSRLTSLLNTLKKNNVEPSKISIQQYRKLDYLLDTKLNTDYFVGELIAEKNPW